MATNPDSVRRRLFVGAAVALASLGACSDGDSGCGGATCPFSVGGYALVRGAVARADGAPATPLTVRVACPGGSAIVAAGAGAGTYEAGLETVEPLPSETGTLVCVVSAFPAGGPAAAETTGVAFSRDRARRPATVVNLRWPARL
jgi:hypothetical protein